MSIIDTHSCITPEEYRAITGQPYKQEVVLTFDFEDVGDERCPHARRAVIYCDPSAEEAVTRSYCKLHETRNWHASMRRSSNG